MYNKNFDNIDSRELPQGCTSNICFLVPLELIIFVCYHRSVVFALKLIARRCPYYKFFLIEKKIKIVNQFLIYDVLEPDGNNYFLCDIIDMLVFDELFTRIGNHLQYVPSDCHKQFNFGATSNSNRKKATQSPLNMFIHSCSYLE